MKIYIITNQALHHDSSYYNVVAAVRTLEDAHIVLGTEKHDFLTAVDNHLMEPDFYDFSALDIVEEEKCLTITDKVTHMWEKWTVDEIELQ